MAGGALTLGQAGSMQGSLSLSGATGGNTSLAAPAAGGGVMTLQAGTDTLVGRATTDTLTHKTLDTAGAGNILKINGVQVNGVQGNSSTILLAGAVSGTGTSLCTDANGNATTAGCQTGNLVTGPVSSVSGSIPVWSGVNGNVLSGGLQLATSVGNPGSSTALPTEAAVRAAINSSGGGTVSSVGTGCGLTGGPITASGTIGTSVPIASKSANYAVVSGDCGAILSMTGSNTFTLPQAGTTGFPAGWQVRLQNAGSGSVTVNTATSTFYGGYTGASVALGANQSLLVVSDGTNWNVANNAPGGGTGSYTAGNGIRVTGGVISDAGLCASAPASDTLTYTTSTSSAASFATTCTIPANALVTGSSIDFVASGTITGGNGSNTYWSFPVKFGTSTILFSAPLGYSNPASNTYVWEIRGTIVVTAAGTSGKLFGTGYINIGNNTSAGTSSSGFFSAQSATGGVGIDTTSGQTFNVAFNPNVVNTNWTAKLTLLRVKVSN